MLLALRLRRYPGVWELAIFHKVALTVSALTLISGAVGTASIVLFDGLVSVFLIASYVLARGVRGMERATLPLSPLSVLPGPAGS